MIGRYPPAGPPRTLAERLEQLNDTLKGLAGRLKEAIASAVSNAVAEAIQDGVRNLLGARTSPQLDHRFDQKHEPEFGHWNEPVDSVWNDEEEYRPGFQEILVEPKQTSSRWRNAIALALQTGLWWMGQQPRRRPVLTTVGVALAAGITALLAGPVLVAGVGVLASATGLLMTANAATTATDKLGSLVAG